MINIANPIYLLLAFCTPLLFLIMGFLMWRQKRRIAALGDPELVKELMPHRSRTRLWVKLTFCVLGLFFLLVGLARPQIGAKLSKKETKGAEIMILLDVSNSMLAEDYSPNRLARAKMSISRLVDKLKDDRIGLIIFAGQSFVQLPITTDYISAKMFLNNITPGSVPVQGTAIGDAILTGIKSFSSQSSKSRAIILITDGENHEDDAVKAAQEAGNEGIRVFTIGVGSTKGALIKIDGSYINDENGSPVVSKLDEKVLLEIAKVGNGAYIHATDTDFGLEKIVDEIAKMDDEEFQSVVFEEYDEQFMYFLGISLFFFTLAALVSARKKSWKLF